MERGKLTSNSGAPIVAEEAAGDSVADACLTDGGVSPLGYRTAGFRFLPEYGLDDTHPDIHAMQIRLFREMPAEQKLELVEDGWQTLRELALADLRSRNPSFSRQQEAAELSRRLLGKDLAEAVGQWSSGRRK